MKWKILIPFSIGIGIVIGALNRIPALYNTSITDMAVVLDVWIVMAIYIIWKCKTAKEAVLKCFLFFLISQPLIYLTEVCIDSLFFGADFSEKLFMYFNNYYWGGGTGWLLWTFLTIPGAFVAFRAKKGDILSAVILSVATGYLGFAGSYGLLNTIYKSFPNHLISAIFCLVMAFVLIFILLKDKKPRIVSAALTSLCIGVGIFMFFQGRQTPIIISEDLEIESTIVVESVESENESVASASLDEESGTVTVYSGTQLGETKLIVTDKDGNKYYYKINSTPDKFTIDRE